MLTAIGLEPDTILHGGKIITVDERFPTVQAVAVKDSRIVAVGHDAEVLALAGEGTRVIDLRGRTVTPGIIDAHNHLYRTGRTSLSIRLHDVRSIGELQERLKEAAKTLPEGRWLYGQGWNESLLAEQRFPTRWDIDEVVPDVPVVINRTWNKLVANSLALELCGVTDDVAWPPPGLLYAGMVQKDENGRLTGLFTDRAKHLVQDKIPFSDSFNEEAILSSCQRYNALGITSVIDPGLRPEELRAYLNVHRRGELTVRTSACVSAWGHTGVRIEEEDGLFDKVHNYGLFSGMGDETLRLDCVKIMPDGGGSDGTAVMYEPFASNPNSYGEPTVDLDRIGEYVWFCHERGWSVEAHCCGDRMQDIVAQAMADAIERAPDIPVRHRIHHGYLPTERALGLMAEYQIAAITQPVFLWSQGESMVHHLGEERANRLMPARTYKERGIPLAFSSDSAVADPNPWLGMYSALTRVSLNGHEFDQTETVDRMEALRGYTQDSAWMTFEEEIKGSITPGKLADMVILDRDYLECPLEEVKAITPHATMLGGTWVSGDPA